MAQAMKKARSGRNLFSDMLFKWASWLCGTVVLLLMAALFLQLALHSLPSIAKFGVAFLWSSEWNPVSQQFGALPSIYGTLVSTAIAMILAAPLSFVIALFLVELAHPSLRRVVSQGLDLLAAIPSIIYGMWGLFVFCPFMQNHIQPFMASKLGFIPFFKGTPMGIGMMSAGIILALMILPFVSAVMRDVFLMVPPVVKESAYGVGATTWEVTWHVTMRYGMKGMLGALFLGLGRAIGETMAITFVIGNAHTISISLFDGGTSIASTLASQFSEAVSQPLFRSVLLELGLVLFIVTFAIQLLAQHWVNMVRKSSGGGL